MRYAAVVLVGLVVAGGASGAVKPKPWAWDTKTASRQVVALGIFGGRGELTVKACAGRGKRVAARWTSFQCSVVWTPRSFSEAPTSSTVYVKVRPVGRGAPCVSLTSLTAVPGVCLAKGVRSGDRNDARNALRLELQRQAGAAYPYQGPSECLARGPGYFECFFGSNSPDEPTNGTAWVLLGSSPRVTVTKAVG